MAVLCELYTPAVFFFKPFSFIPGGIPHASPALRLLAVWWQLGSATGVQCHPHPCSHQSKPALPRPALVAELKVMGSTTLASVFFILSPLPSPSPSPPLPSPPLSSPPLPSPPLPSPPLPSPPLPSPPLPSPPLPSPPLPSPPLPSPPLLLLGPEAEKQTAV